MIDTEDTFTLTAETGRIVKVPPALGFTFVDIYCRAATPFVVWNIHCGTASLGHNEGVVYLDIDGTEILGTVDAAVYLLKASTRVKCFVPSAAPVLYRKHAAFYNVKGISRMIMPGKDLSGRDGKCPDGHSSGTGKKIRAWNSTNSKDKSA